MFKKYLIFLFILVLVPNNASASGQSGQYYPPSNSDYYMKKFTWQIYVSKGVNKIIFTQYDINMKYKGYIYYNNPPQNAFFWTDFTCRGIVSVEFFDKKGKVVDSFIRGPGTSYLDNSSCNYKRFAAPSNYDEKKRKYKGDKFKRKKSKY